ncbi:MAG: bifunctional UDP-N-acetylglucosamine diphosphorylase/glucosamine-1-phosphate N-acetyltransferase GlmU [Clostridia bacterium]|nr:bifunctional UDP-N-acetylglucosamine diphosphorylase/glucosamine-1-phosphate N-acetyltransferase GlmU [Clostridia bacterium]MCI8980057.1 bifunctional UDP-N-acetylglucosamine diphosphorylase/glucosamine-1-phosphate N-acetyltransferase GlmU [Clostridia bacterium]MCI9085715.1 bifunctional UDP-N-acetylglucosamine diphosphorylase/glucosamine-1-phosphate N-acetyltransferase GlmU [Clostridia bacterium]
MSFTSVIMAAGMGTRMKSKMPKVIHKVCGKEICRWVIDAAKNAGSDKVCTIIGHRADMVKEILGDICEFALQAEQKGTGHAVMQAIDVIKSAKKEVVILNGDIPLITAESIKKAVNYHRENGNQATVITAVLDDATGYGRIVRGDDGGVRKIVEQKDANDEEKKINEINSGMYVFDSESLLYALEKLTPNNAQGEYYLTDTLEILLNAGKKVGGYAIADNDEIRGINDRIQLDEAEKIMQKRINEYHMRNGVTIRNPQSVCIEDDVEIGSDSEIYQNVTIKSGTKIGSDCVIGSGSTLDKAVIGDGVNVISSVIIESEVGAGTNVGPFAYIRPNCTVGSDVKVGDFVELKNSTIGDGTKISHLTYIGDSDVGKGVNFGCGTVTVNYDGKKKYRTVIGDNCFIGCNTNLVSPVNVGDGAYIAAGSTITEDIPEDNLSIARARQVNKDGWKDKRK